MRSGGSDTDQRDRLSRSLEAVGQGDRAALKDVYQLTSAKLYGICLRILNDRAEAEDALQDVYVSLWRHAARFDAKRASPISWLSVFARNRAIDRLRSARRARDTAPIEAAGGLADDRPSAFAQVSAHEEEVRLSACLDELSGQQRNAIRETFLSGATYSELAEREGTPLGTVKSWIRRGLQQLKACLEK